MPKELLYSEEARRALERGVNAVANAVRVTLIPRGAMSFWIKVRRTIHHEGWSDRR